MNFGVLHIKLPNGLSREIQVQQASLSVGRAPENALIIEHISLSRRHARLTFEGGRLTVEDLGSANGSFVGGQRLEPNTPALVPVGQPLKLGAVEISFVAPLPPPAAGVSRSAEVTTSLPAAALAGRFGVLSITVPGSAPRECALEQPSLTVGRAAENGLVLEHASVSRRHARLDVESGRLMITDLGSANGTFIGAQRLTPETPALLTAEQVLRLGEVEIRYTPPPPVEAEHALHPEPTTPAVGGPVVNISLAGPAQAVTPGAVVTASLTVQNRGSVVDEVRLGIAGLPSGWVRLSKDRVSLLPNTQEQVTLSFQPLRLPEAIAGEHRFTVTAVSREHGATATVTGTLKILPFQSFALSLQPVRSRRDFNLIAHNQGNAPVEYRLSAADDEQSLDYAFRQTVILLPPGQRVSVPLQVTPKIKPRVGARETRTFSVIATPTDSTLSESRAAGQLIIRPPIPLWLIPLLLLVMICGCLGAAYAYFTFCPTYAPGLPLCPAGALPRINVFDAAPREVEKDGLVVLSWDVSDAALVELTAPVQETLADSGQRVFNPEQSTTYTLRASNNFGQVTQSVEVKVKGAPPVIQSFTATPGTVVSGQTDRIVLSWTVAGATSVSIEGVPAQTFDPRTGNVTVVAPAQTTTYKLVATNDAGTVERELTVPVSSAGCVVSDVGAGDRLNMRSGPSKFHAIVEKLDNGTPVEPVGRNAIGDWLKVRAAGKEGWVSSAYVTCSVEFNVFATVDPASIPTPPPTATPTLPPPTATPTFTPIPRFGGGFVALKQRTAGGVNIVVVPAAGEPWRLVENAAEADILDYTRAGGGRFALRVVVGGAHKLWVVRLDGTPLKADYTAGWTTIADGDWSPDGQRLVIEAVAAGGPTYYYFDADGNLLASPSFP